MLKGVCVGAGYFSWFQYEAWSRIAEVKITAICNQDKEKAITLANEFSIPKVYTSVVEMLDEEQPGFIDIITPPESHLEYCREAFKRKVNVIVQKPFAPTFEEATQIVKEAKDAGVRLMVHENFRFQPWYREVKKMISDGTIGAKIFTAIFRTRTGDGWGENAYLDRQPYFREMPLLLIYETGIHFIDTLRYLFGEVSHVYASLRKLNPLIKGEDAAIVHLEFVSGMQAVWDANRYNESNSVNPRYTFAEVLIEGEEGSLRLYGDGRITLQRLGCKEEEHTYYKTDKNFAGDCVFGVQTHFIQAILSNGQFETSGEEYLKNIEVQEAVYLSNELKERVEMERWNNVSDVSGSGTGIKTLIL